MTAVDTDLEQRAINVIRGLCMDGPEAAKNGHPGTGMALAPLAHVLCAHAVTCRGNPGVHLCPPFIRC